MYKFGCVQGIRKEKGIIFRLLFFTRVLILHKYQDLPSCISTRKDLVKAFSCIICTPNSFLSSIQFCYYIFFIFYGNHIKLLKGQPSQVVKFSSNPIQPWQTFSRYIAEQNIISSVQSKKISI